jgi:hypothetical protein
MKFVHYTLLLACAIISVVTLSAQQTHRVVEYTNTVNPKQSVRMTSNGILIVGKAPTARAMSGFYGKSSASSASIDCCSFYRSSFIELRPGRRFLDRLNRKHHALIIY